MIRYHASWILPISEPPIRDGWFAVDRGRVAALGAAGKRVLADGAATVAGTDKTVPVATLARTAYHQAHRLGGDISPGITESETSLVAGRPPKRLLRCATSSAGVVIAPAPKRRRPPPCGP